MKKDLYVLGIPVYHLPDAERVMMNLSGTKPSGIVPPRHHDIDSDEYMFMWKVTSGYETAKKELDMEDVPYTEYDGWYEGSNWKIMESNQITEEKLRDLIRETMKDELMNQMDDVDEIASRIHKVWSELTKFHDLEVNPKIQKTAHQIDSLQIPWDKSADLKEEMYDLQYELNEVIKKFKEFPSRIRDIIERSDADHPVKDVFRSY